MNKMKILYIDDNTEILEMFELFFSGKNYEIKTLSEAQLAVQTINIFQPDVLFIDYRMPDINGIDIVAQIDYQKIKAFLVSGELSFSDPRISEMFQEVLKKPLSLFDIQKLLEQLAKTR